MRKVIKVNVTQDDIDRGTAGNCRYCPVAIAVERAGLYSPNVFVTSVFYDRNIENRVQTFFSKEVSEFIAAFDWWETDRKNEFVQRLIHPFSFELEIEVDNV